MQELWCFFTSLFWQTDLVFCYFFLRRTMKMARSIRNSIKLNLMLTLVRFNFFSENERQRKRKIERAREKPFASQVEYIAHNILCENFILLHISQSNQLISHQCARHSSRACVCVYFCSLLLVFFLLIIFFPQSVHKSTIWVKQFLYQLSLCQTCCFIFLILFVLTF